LTVYKVPLPVAMWTSHFTWRTMC